MRYKSLFVLLACAALGRAATFSGTLDPASNPNLTTWDQFLPGYVSPIAGPDDWDRSYNIAVHTFPVVSPGLHTIASLGGQAGGIDAVVSVFQGIGVGASYMGHQYAPIAGDNFNFALDLAAGDYTLTVSMFLNEPCAAGACLGAGTFGDGFSNLVNYDPLRTLDYEVTVESGGQARVPEPAVGWGVPVLVAVMAARKFRMRRLSI